MADLARKEIQEEEQKGKEKTSEMASTIALEERQSKGTQLQMFNMQRQGAFVFPEPILRLPEADVGLAGLKAYLSQGEGHQVLFMKFSEDVEVPEHCHAAQWGVILEGKIDLTVNGNCVSYTKGDVYYIPYGVNHSARIHAGYADVTFFDQKDRYRPKPK